MRDMQDTVIFLGGVLRRDNGALHYFASVMPKTVTLFESYQTF